MAPVAKFSSALESCSYQSPDGGSAYAPLREKMICAATAMGYDTATMVECGINWAEDHDTLHHAKISAYLQFINQCRIREFLSFEPFVGKEKFQDMIRFRGIGFFIRNFTVDLKRPVKFPDSLIVASHITEVFPDRYVTITSMWSLAQQVIVADFKASVLFFDYGRNVPANLLEAGGVYKDLYEALKERSAREVAIAAKWEEEHPKKSKAVL